MKSELHQLFVYGSLRRGFHHPAYDYISRYFEFVSEGRVRGCLADMGEYAAGVPAAEDHFIRGELYRIRDEAQWSYAMAQLDDYEGLGQEPGEPALFRREAVEVLLPQGSSTAWIYWYNGDIQGRPVIASGDVLAYIQSKK
ncbi:MAG TPA: gamma-glutamylcyclotransferase family protein [Chitinophagaceae bacterium]|nr:gamma-glutamylcyclotransferase family protein [Chitinophagaceae bacterium]